MQINHIPRSIFESKRRQIFKDKTNFEKKKCLHKYCEIYFVVDIKWKTSEKLTDARCCKTLNDNLTWCVQQECWRFFFSVTTSLCYAAFYSTCLIKHTILTEPRVE